ncbi:MAG: menaquinone biosynthesis protein [Candidatus Caenarcaniphilales bacterium]|nr:menaquinone biosynthesis protein [Candidatus Caenarcaniphilales bacterium]
MRFKVGFVKYLNSWPLYNGLDSSVVDSFFGTPAEIWQALEAGSVDYAQLPSYEYLRNRKKFELFDGFCITTKKKTVKSVLFFSNKPITELHKEEIFYTDHSRTSVNLLKVLLAQNGSKDNKWSKQSLSCQDLLNQRFANALIIGDEALLAWKLAKEGKLSNYYCYDLADEWFKLTSLNFVFAVFVANKKPSEDKQFANKQKQKLQEVLQKNLENNLASLALKKVDFKSKLSNELILEYLDGIDYSLNCERMNSLDKFANYLGFVTSTLGL